MQDISASYAVFMEQESSASQMTAQVLDVIASVPGYAGQANDAISA